MECKRKENETSCVCPYESCERHGMCCECVAYHRSGGELPMCLRETGTSGG